MRADRSVRGPGAASRPAIIGAFEMYLSAGTRLGPYEVVSLLGKGGMGEVYRARDPRLGRDVAVKVLPEAFSSDPDHLRRFDREARAASALQHPGILTVYDTGTHEGVPYVVSELLEGSTLRDALQAGAIPVATAIGYAVQIAEAVGTAHDKGVVHRDLKPENLFVMRGGRIKVLDFGLAKVTGPPQADEGTSEITLSQTAPGVTLGTAGYMSPEQVRGLPADTRSDVFSFGAVLYEMLAGRRAFGGETAAERMTAILRQDPPPLAGVGASIPEALQDVVARCLEKDAQKRFQTAAELALALAAAGSQAAEPAGRSGDGKTAPALPRRRVPGRPLAIGATVMALIALATALHRRTSVPATDPPGPSARNTSPAADVSEVVAVKKVASSPEAVAALQPWIGSLTGGPGLSLRRVDAGHIEVRGPAGQVLNAISAIQVLDALDGHRFFEEPSLFQNGGESSREISFDFDGIRVASFIQVVARAAGWPVVLDRSVQGTMTLKLNEVWWDQAVQTSFELNNLRATRYGDAWLVSTRERALDMEQRDLPFVYAKKPRRTSLAAMVKALEAVRSETGVIAPNSRLGTIFIVERPDAFPNYARILAAVDREEGEAGVPRPSYTGSKVTLEFPDGRLQDIFRLYADLSGLNVVVEPGIDGGVSASIRDLAWDNALDLILRSQDLQYELRGNLLRIGRYSEDSEVVVETVALRHEDPEFFRPFARYLGPSGTLDVESRSKTLIIRDVRKRAVWLREQAEAIDRLTR